MSSAIKSFLTISLSFFLWQNVYAIDYKIESYYYPSSKEAQKIKSYPYETTLMVCCHYPDQIESINLKSAGIKKLIIKGGHFPSLLQIKRLESLKIPYEIILEEVFPSTQNINHLNNSTVSKLTVFSQDFPTLGEVQAFNQLKINFRFNITKNFYPLPEHMIVINQFNPNFTVAFYNEVPPGPGYANFFNNLRTHKIFVITKKFPYGMDYVGLNLLTNSAVEFLPEERIMPQDLPILNAVDIKSSLWLTNPEPINDQILLLIQNLDLERIVITDSGTGNLMSSEFIHLIQNSLSPITLKFFHYH